MNPCLASTTRRAARNLTRLYEHHLASTNLTPAQFELLSLLAQHPGIAQNELAVELDLDPTTLSRNLRLLIGQRWVRRTTSPTDHRQAAYTLTPAGLATRQAALPHWQRAQTRMREALGTDWPTAFAILDRLSAAAAT